MNSRVERYLIDQLAACGFVVVESRLAHNLRRDIWHSPTNCWTDFVSVGSTVEPFLRSLDCKLFWAHLDGEQEAYRLAAKSAARLRDRLQEILGVEVDALKPAQSFRAQEERSVVRQAADDVPSWPCEARREALAKAGKSEDRFAKQR